MVHSRVGPHTVHMGPEMALGVNSHASHDLRLNDASQAAVFLNLYLNDAWLDAQCKDLAHAMVLPHPCIGITPEVNVVCAKLLTQLASPPREHALGLEADVAGLSRSRFFELFHDQLGT